MLKLATGDNRSESRGQRVRRLDMLLHRLKKEKENYSGENWLLNTGDLERLRNEVRYCFLDAGLPAGHALRELSAMDFTRFKVLDEESHKAKYHWIDPSSCRVLDAESEKQCIQNLDRLIELVERVRKTEETGSEIKPAVDPSSPQTAEKTSSAVRDLATRLKSVSASSPEKTEKTSPPLRDLATLLKLKSVSQSQAAEAFAISSRAIRDLVRNNKLTKTARGRIACDQKFVDQFHSRHSPIKK